jgi:protein-S-isoprenylcysteine O-methyltransferase Ste14
MEQQENKLKLTPFHRVCSVALVIAQYLLFFGSNAMLVHYHAFPIPGLSLPSMVLDNSEETHYVHNTCLLLLFWGQHILMATLTFKLKCLRQYPYFALYDRYLYNVVSGITLAGIIVHLKPSSHLLLLVVPTWVCLPLTLAGAFLLLRAMKVVGKGIMMPYKLNQLLTENYLETKPYEALKSTNLTTRGVYGVMRHPMQAGALLMIIFGNGVYTL